MADISSNNKRIIKNTILLYSRTIVTMIISLFTSRIILDALGVEDYGIYNVVGGVVTMFSVISGTMSSSISRFITFELGKNNKEKLQKIFSASINIQIFISIIIIILGETIGLWFVTNIMSIPTNRIYAAEWVLHCSLFSFCLNLLSIPYNACIIAHEKMSAFAYISILEVVLKLIIVYLLYLSPFDKLQTYSILFLCVAIIIRITYGIYCNRHFKECHYIKVHDKSLIKEMTSFAGWTFFTNAAYIFNTQGINILMNLFFGVTVNAARGITVQVESAVMKFINDFTTAINPQITKNYATGNIELMNNLICKGAKYSYFLLFFLSLPILIETNYILTLWLKITPDYTALFLRLSLIGSMLTILGNTGYTACMATGVIKRYVLWVTSVGCLTLPISWIAFKMGAPVYSTYIAYIFTYILVDIVRLWIMKGLLNFPIMMFVREVIYKCLWVTCISLIVPLFILKNLEPSFIRFLYSCFFCILSTSLSIYIFGLSKNERIFLKAKIINMISKLKK